MASKFLGGSPVSATGNPFNSGVGAQAGADSDILPSLDIDARESGAMSDLDAYGSSPVTGDGAAQRPNGASLSGSVASQVQHASGSLAPQDGDPHQPSSR